MGDRGSKRGAKELREHEREGAEGAEEAREGMRSCREGLRVCLRVRFPINMSEISIVLIV